jgi:hypothetical protein
MNLDDLRMRSEHARREAIAAIERSKALAEEAARRAESRGDQAGVARELAHAQRAEALLARLRDTRTDARARRALLQAYRDVHGRGG